MKLNSARARFKRILFVCVFMADVERFTGRSETNGRVQKTHFLSARLLHRTGV